MIAFAFLRPETSRTILLILLGVGYVGYHAMPYLRRLVERRKKKASARAGAKAAADVGLTGAAVVRAPAAERRVAPVKEDSPRSMPEAGASGEQASRERAPTPSAAHPTAASATEQTGDELYAKARGMPHQVIPDFDLDGPYLELLGASAAKGYRRALQKLGEYAMRRGAWVEAYYWISMAKRQGMSNADAKLREIRQYWSADGFPDQLSNINRIFTEEAGSIGRALLHVDSGQDAAKARAFLRANHPEFLNNR